MAGSVGGFDAKALGFDPPRNLPQVWPLQDTDGCIVELYDHLWQKNSKTGRSCPGISVPETVVYTNKRVSNWYFTSSQDKQIKRKHAQSRNDESIFENLIKQRGSTKGLDVFATYMHAAEHAQQVGEATRVEYLGVEELRSFLFHSAKPARGMLQKFLSSKGEHHSVVRATWSPQVCLLERRVNRHRVRDKQVQMHERCVTFEGSEQFSSSAPISGTALATHIQALCANIVEHVAHVSSQCISRMICHFQVDESGRVWFLFCSCLRMTRSAATNQPRTPVNPDPAFHVVAPDVILAERAPTATAARSLTAAPVLVKHSTFTCPGCRSVERVEDRYEVTYKAVMQHWSRQARAACAAASESDTLEVQAALSEMPFAPPPIICALEGQLSPEQFAAVQGDPTFLYRCAHLCESCCLDHNHTVLTDLNSQNPSAEVSVPGSRPRSAATPRSLHHLAYVEPPRGRHLPADPTKGSPRRRPSSSPAMTATWQNAVGQRGTNARLDREEECRADRPLSAGRADAHSHSNRPTARRQLSAHRDRDASSLPNHSALQARPGASAGPGIVGDQQLEVGASARQRTAALTTIRESRELAQHRASAARSLAQPQQGPEAAVQSRARPPSAPLARPRPASAIASREAPPRPRPPSAPLARGAKLLLGTPGMRSAAGDVALETRPIGSDARVEYTPATHRSARASQPVAPQAGGGGRPGSATSLSSTASGSVRGGKSRALPEFDNSLSLNPQVSIQPPLHNSRPGGSEAQQRSAYSNTPASKRPMKSALSKKSKSGSKQTESQSAARSAAQSAAQSASQAGRAAQAAATIASHGPNVTFNVSSSLTPEQEELVKQALASTKDKSSLEGLTRGRASVDVDVDALSSLIDDLRSESSRGSFSRAWMQVQGGLPDMGDSYDEDEDVEHLHVDHSSPLLHRTPADASEQLVSSSVQGNSLGLSGNHPGAPGSSHRSAMQHERAVANSVSNAHSQNQKTQVEPHRNTQHLSGEQRESAYDFLLPERKSCHAHGGNEFVEADSFHDRLLSFKLDGPELDETNASRPTPEVESMLAAPDPAVGSSLDMDTVFMSELSEEERRFMLETMAA